MGSIVDAIKTGLLALANYFGWAKQRSEVNNAPDVKNAKKGQDAVKEEDAIKEDVANNDLDAIRKRLG